MWRSRTASYRRPAACIPSYAAWSGTPERLAGACSSRTSRPRQGECAQYVEVNLGIDLCHLRAAMPQQLSDLAQRGAMTQHVGGQCMAELMGPRETASIPARRSA